MTEREVIALAKHNPKAFAVLYEKYYSLIFRFVFKRIQREAQTADVVSTVFLKALLNLPKYTDRGHPFSSWLYRIAINECNQFFRSNSKKMEVSIEGKVIKDMTREVFSTTEDEHTKILLAALNMLTFDELNIVELRFFENRRFKEIGEILGISPDNAKVRLYRAVKKLKKIMAQKIGAINKNAEV